jgi:hypothetical protein
LQEKRENRHSLTGGLIGIFIVGLIAIALVILYTKRQTRIDQVKGQVQAELDHLDPIGRAQVLASIVDEEFGVRDRLHSD